MGYLCHRVLVVSFGGWATCSAGWDVPPRVLDLRAGLRRVSVTCCNRTAAAWWLIAMRILQAVGGAMLMPTRSRFDRRVPGRERGLALGRQPGVPRSPFFYRAVLGGILGPAQWLYVFLVRSRSASLVTVCPT